MNWLAEERGSAVVTIVMLPFLVLIVASTFELGSLRVVAARAQTAADLAALVGLNDQDDAELRLSGRLRPAADAERVARVVLAENLAPVSANLALPPSEIASRAVVTISYPPASVRIGATIPVRLSLFGALLARPEVDLPIRATASAR